PLEFVDPTGEDLKIVVTNIVVTNNKGGKNGYVNHRPNGGAPRETVNTYKMTVTNESGHTRTFTVTRDTNYNGTTSDTRGQYISHGETPPGEYSGQTRTGGDKGFRIELSDTDRPGTGLIRLPDGTDKQNAQIHIGLGCSEGCVLIKGGIPERDRFEQGVTTLLNEDKKN